MPAVQFMVWAVDSDVNDGDTARTEHNLLPAALMHRAIANQPDIAPQQALVFLDDGCQVRRTRLLLAFENELDVRVQRDSPRFQRIQCSADGNDRSLVVGGRSCV